MAGSVHSGSLLHEVTQGHSNSVRAVNGYGDTLVSGSYDTTVRVWSINTGKCKFVLSGHHKQYMLLFLIISVIDASLGRLTGM